MRCLTALGGLMLLCLAATGCRIHVGPNDTGCGNCITACRVRPAIGSGMACGCDATTSQGCGCDSSATGSGCGCDSGAGGCDSGSCGCDSGGRFSTGLQSRLFGGGLFRGGLRSRLGGGDCGCETGSGDCGCGAPAGVIGGGSGCADCGSGFGGALAGGGLVGGGLAGGGLAGRGLVGGGCPDGSCGPGMMNVHGEPVYMDQGFSLASGGAMGGMVGHAGGALGCGQFGCGVGGRLCLGCRIKNGFGGRGLRAYGPQASHPYGGQIPHTDYMGAGVTPQAGAAPTYAYPYYTIRGPRDFLQANPPSIGW